MASNNSDKNVLKRIEELMQERGWSVYRLAQESGVNEGTIRKEFARGNQPSLPILEQICDAFGITVAQFFLGDDTPVNLSSDQRMMLYKIGLLSKKEQESVMGIVDCILARGGEKRRKRSA